MVKLSQQIGSVLIIVLIILALMLSLVLTLNRLAIYQERSAANYADIELAKNYAHYAMLKVEEIVFAYDKANNMEELTPLMRLAQIQKSANASYLRNNCASSGWCYAAFKNFLPWEENISGRLPPCSSYIVATKEKLPLLDAEGVLPIIETQDHNLCAEPRYLIELVNANFVGPMANTSERGILTQLNGASITLYDEANPKLATGRIYRITLRAFGKNGNTRVTLQEYLLLIANTHLRNSYESENMLSHQIILLAQRWL